MNGPRQAALGLEVVRLPTPTVPTWFDAAGGQENRQAFADLAELARHVVGLVGERGLRVAAVRATTAAPGLGLFPAWSIYAIDSADGEEWLGQAAIQETPRERLEAAIAAAARSRRPAA